MNRARKTEQRSSQSPLRLLAWLTSKRDQRRTARELYGSIVTQARLPCFYADWGIPDTPQGRFEMIVLHLALALHRLASVEGSGQRLARALTEAFVIDMDDSMREMTFSDLAVPREIKHAVAALFDRNAAYRIALAQVDGAVTETTLARQMGYLNAAGRLDAPSLAQYMREAADLLERQSDDRLLSGRISWPDFANSKKSCGR
jgi:cytochrome b pre-mRNA-processing protein 3